MLPPEKVCLPIKLANFALLRYILPFYICLTCLEYHFQCLNSIIWGLLLVN